MLAERIHPFRVDPEAPDRVAAMLAVARALAPGWADAAAVRVEPVGGGITNLLFRLEDGGRAPLLLRVYGRNTEVVIDRERENRLFARLSTLGFAPPYYGRFENGRLEGFLPGFRALEPAEMGRPTLRRKIASQLRTLHGISTDASAPGLWTTLEGWLGTAAALRFGGDAAERHAALELPRRQALLRTLRSAFEARYAHGPGARVVLAHNDLLSGNVLHDEASGAVRFIDFEYSGPNFAAFDIANHFCEHAGFSSDFERDFPPQEVQDDFLDAYLGPEQRDRAAWEEAVRFFVLPDHLFWGSWAVIQARYSPIDFDFLGYAALRMRGLDHHLATLGVAL